MSDFTKGDWIYGYNPGLTGPTTPTEQPFCGGNDWPYRTVTVGNETIAIIPAQDSEPRIVGKHGQPLFDAMEANAHLIKAAPKMCEALKGIIADLENIVQPYILEATKEALAEAEVK